MSKKLTEKVIVAFILGLFMLQGLPNTALGAFELSSKFGFSSVWQDMKKSCSSKLSSFKLTEFKNKVIEINAAHFRKSRSAYTFREDTARRDRMLKKISNSYEKLVYGMGTRLLQPFNITVNNSNSTVVDE